MNLQTANDLAKKMVLNEDAAVAEFIKAQASCLSNYHEIISDYEMVRESKMGFPVSTVTYKIRKIEEK